MDCRALASMDYVIDRFAYPLRGSKRSPPVVRWLLGCGAPCLFYTTPRGRRAAVFLHGNDCSLSDLEPFVSPFATFANCDVLCLTYPGYPGGSKPTAHGRAYDADVALQTALAARELSSKYRQVFVMAHSLGCNAALRSLQHFTPSGGLILFSPFASLRSAATHRVGPLVSRLVPGDRMDNVAAASGVQCDVLIMHGNADEIVPPCESARVEAALSHRHAKRVQRCVVPGLDHALSRDMATRGIECVNQMWPSTDAMRPRPAPQLQFRT
jgi:pimeloyl-ACP methyl ester carboxylesterase